MKNFSPFHFYMMLQISINKFVHTDLKPEYDLNEHQ